jgi:hypothetical protein
MKTQKTYSIEASPLYGIPSKKKLATVLNTTPPKLHKLEKDPIFAVFMKDDRPIQEPKGLERVIHDRIQTLLSRITSPDYVFSGKRGVCYIDNAKSHVRNTDVFAADIYHFYRSTKKEYVFRFFYYIMKMSADVAHLMSGICCYKDMLPTGSPLSQSLAFWAYSPMFGEIYSYAKKEGYTFSLYVDDMVFSRNTPIPRSFHLAMNAILKKYSLHLKKTKIHYRGKNQYKRVTGCIISPSHQMLVPNWQREKIRDLLKALSSEDAIQKQETYQSLLGSIASAQQIEPDIYQESRKALRAVYNQKRRTSKDKTSSD